MPQVRVGAAGRGAAGPLLGLEVWGSVLSACACGACLCWSWYLATRNCSQRFRANNSLNRERSSGMWALESHCPGTPPETLKEERQSGCVPPTSLEGNSLKKSNWGFLFTGIVGGTLVAVYAVATPFITPALRRICLPFVPATAKQIENVVKMLRCRRGPLVDIGSGDGRIVSYAKMF
ncbi:hypothetical protein J1605_022229 [Eschrichtius robustus]|uniref:Protein FAM173B n=1 Tax=Eschrichtius robustus TaxID=9764 RepID=A0AB34HAW2_ESCRO|nr:hypothetical protein J1605_022229 [Eschrichtius robustus]